MKIGNAMLLLAAGLLFGQCSNEVVSPKPDYDQISRDLMTELQPQLLGTWRMRQLQVRAEFKNSPFQAAAGIKKDTIFQDFAVLTIRPAAVSSTNPPDPRYPDFEGDLIFRGTAYPIRFSPLASPDRVVNGRGPNAFFSFEFSRAPGSYPLDPEREYLKNLGLIQDNFTLELLADGKDMVWRGLNRGIVKIELQKQ